MEAGFHFQGLPGPVEILSLDTPLPTTVPQIIVDNPIDEDNKSPTKTRDNALSSIVPKKREKFLSSQSLPTSTTLEDEDEITASDAGTNLETVEEILTDSVEDILGDTTDVMAVSSSTLQPATEMPVASQTLNTVIAKE